MLARARIATLTARGDETLTLVARGSGQSYEKHYGEVSGQLTGLLAEGQRLATSPAVRDAADSAVRNNTAWQDVHKKIRQADDSGDFTSAVSLALGADPASAATAFDRLDSDLVEAITQARKTSVGSVADARGALSGSVVVVVLLSLLAAVASTMGLWQRLKEYR